MRGEAVPDPRAEAVGVRASTPPTADDHPAPGTELIPDPRAGQEHETGQDRAGVRGEAVPDTHADPVPEPLAAVPEPEAEVAAEAALDPGDGAVVVTELALREYFSKWSNTTPSN